MNATSKHEFTPIDIPEYHQDKSGKPPMAASAAAQPVHTPSQSAPAVSAPAAPVGGYVPKQGDLTVDEVEEEIGMLLQRMEFLEKTLQRLKKENAKDLSCVCDKQVNRRGPSTASASPEATRLCLTPTCVAHCAHARPPAPRRRTEARAASGWECLRLTHPRLTHPPESHSPPTGTTTPPTRVSPAWASRAG